jgi:hypothetical protein
VTLAGFKFCASTRLKGKCVISMASCLELKIIIKNNCSFIADFLFIYQDELREEEECLLSLTADFIN